MSGQPILHADSVGRNETGGSGGRWAPGLDRTGLLHQLTREIADLNLTIGSAHIGTYGEKAVDVFYVTDLTGHKIESKVRQKKIRDALLGVFNRRANEAERPRKVANG